MAKDRMYYSRPPVIVSVSNAVQEMRINLPEHSAKYIGDQDELYDLLLLEGYADMMGKDKVFVLSGQRHNLEKAVMQHILNAKLEL